MCENRIQAINEAFLRLKPIIERHADFVFRRLRLIDREDAIAEAVAAAFKSYVSLIRRGKDPFQFPNLIATRAAQHVLNARRIGSRCHKSDVFARARKSNADCRLRTLPTERETQWPDALVDNRHTPVPEQVSFRCDFPQWLQTLTHRDRTIANLLAVGHSSKMLADRFGLSPARICQLRGELYAEWQNFHGESLAVAG